MEVLRKSVDELLPHISEAFLNSISENPNVARQALSLKDVEQLITQSIYYFLDFPDMNHEKLTSHIISLGETFYESGVPISLSLDFIDYVKHELIKSMIADMTDPDYQQFLLIFSSLSRGVSKGYLLNYVSENFDFNLYLISVFRVTKYYTCLIDWLNTINRAIFENNTDQLPELNPYSAELGLLMHQPQIQMILGEEPENSDLMAKYYEIFDTANLMAFYFEKQDFRQLYTLILNLFEKADAFQRKLSEALALFSESVSFYFNRYVMSLIEDKKDISIVVINVNNLNRIRNLFNKEAGDKILDTIHMIVDRFVATTDFNTVYIKAQNDEFRIAVVDLPTELANRLVQTLKQKISNLTISYQDYNLPFYISFGTICFDPQYDYTSIDLEKVYQGVVDRAKSNKRNETYLNSENIHAVIDQITNNDKKVIQIRNIFRDSLIEPFFQPIFSLETKEIAFVEVLARFKDEGSIYSIGSFIDLLVELDSIVELDMMILNCLLEYVGFFKENNIDIFINVNPASFKSPSYLEVIQSFLRRIRKMGVDPVFEITEQALLENMDAIESLYIKHNVKFALDDFGAGYSSLQMVVMLSERGLLKYLKIDGSLIKDIAKSEKTYQVVDSIRYMASNLKVDTIAEFIEDNAIMEKCCELGLNYAQGYHLSKPMNIIELTEMYKSK